jgi:hypothetical protein
MSASTAEDRLVGINVALGVGLLSSIVVMAATSEPFAFAGIPVAGLFGGLLAPRLRRASAASWVGVVLLMAGGCTVAGAYAMLLLWSGDPFGSLVLAAFGLIFFGPQAFVLLLAPSIAWASITALWLARGPSPLSVGTGTDSGTVS